MLSGTDVPRRRALDRTLLLPAVVIVSVMFGTYLAQTQILGRIPLQNLLKNALHVDRSGNAAFFFWLLLPWYFKPLMGILSDAVPLFGSRRRSYMLLGGLLATLAWFAVAGAPQRYGPLLLICLAVNVGMVIASTVMGGYMVEVAQAGPVAGRITSIRSMAQQLSVVVAGPAGGMLAGVSLGWTALVCGSIALLPAAAALWCLREPVRATARPTRAAAVLRDAGRQLAGISTARTLWATAGLAALFYCAPGLSTAVFYLQQNSLHLGTPTQGWLTFLSGAGGLLAAALYGAFAARRWSLRTLLMVCLALGTAGNLAYLFYSSLRLAEVVESFNGFGFTLAELALFHLMVRTTPAGSEALGFSLLMAVRNLCLFGSDWFGSGLLDHFHFGFRTLVLANAATSALTVPLVLCLPAAVVRVRDRRVSDAAIDLTPVVAHSVKE